MADKNNVVLIEKKDRVAIITVNRPEKMNALSPDVRVGVAMALEQLRRDDEVRVVVIRAPARRRSSPARTSPSSKASPP